MKKGQLVLNKGKWKGNQVIAEKYINMMMKPTPQYKNYGKLWWLWEYEKITYTVDDSIIAEIKSRVQNPYFVKKHRQLKGVYANVYEYLKALRNIFGEDWRDQIIEAGLTVTDIRKKQLYGQPQIFASNGYLGNYLYIIPEKNMVAIRMISYDSFDREADVDNNFINFQKLLMRL